MKKYLALSILVIIIMTTLGSCSKKGENKGEIDINGILQALDHVVNIRYNGVDTINHELLQKHFTEETYKGLIEGFNRELKPYISVEEQYKDAERAFNAYKDRLEKKNNSSIEYVKDAKNKVNETDLDGIESQEEQEGDPASEYDARELMLLDIYNAGGELVWKGITKEDAEAKTDEEILEFLQIREEALNSFKKKGEENRKKQEEQKKIEEQRIKDSKLQENNSNNIIEINMDDFPTDKRIQVVEGQHVIMINDINVYEDVVTFIIYGMEYSIDISNVEKPYESCKGDEIYNFERVYYAFYDNGSAVVTYSSKDDDTNRANNIKIEISIINGKVNIGNIKDLISTSW